MPSKINNSTDETLGECASDELCSNNVMIFDWDDTLFPKTELSNLNNKQITLQNVEQLSNLSKYIYNTLNAYISKYSTSNIIIVSASTNGWIKYSLSYLYQIGEFSKIYNLLFGLNEGQTEIKMYHPQQPLSSKQVYSWKYNIFKKIYKEYYNPDAATINTFVSIGDSSYEFEAAQKAKQSIITDKKNSNLFVHRIKLTRHPSINDMINQLNLLKSLCGVYESISMVSKVEETINYENEKLRLLRNKKV